ncbi:MAG TPA: GTPase ObgE, partial [Gemmatimonadaceae bacterium]|nr:GTPase ObgE [Gemmatimonadaceae bacterium]
AHEGKGLGLRFLRHIERTRLLAFLIPVDSMDWQDEYRRLRHEVASYSHELSEKPHCVVWTKMDLLGSDPAPPIDAPGAFGVYSISAAARTGMDTLLAGWWSKLQQLRLESAQAKSADAAL